MSGGLVLCSTCGGTALAAVDADGAGVVLLEPEPEPAGTILLSHHTVGMPPTARVVAGDELTVMREQHEYREQHGGYGDVGAFGLFVAHRHRPGSPLAELPPLGRTFRFVAVGRAVPAGSKKQLGGHDGRPRVIVDDSGKRGKAWRLDVANAAAFALEDRGLPLTPPMFTGPVAVAMVFEVARAKRPAAGLESWPAKAPDVLKLARAVEDALTGCLWADDALIVSEYLLKRYAPQGTPERVTVTVHEVAP